MYYELKSKKLKKTITFTRPESIYPCRGGIYVDLTGGHKPERRGELICRGGRLNGFMIEYSGNDRRVFIGMCKKWWKNYRRKNL